MLHLGAGSLLAMDVPETDVVKVIKGNPQRLLAKSFAPSFETEKRLSDPPHLNSTIEFIRRGAPPLP